MNSTTYKPRHQDNTPRPECTCRVYRVSTMRHDPACAVMVERRARLGLTR